MLQIPAIIEALKELDIPVIDRAACERLFGLGRRRAIQMMHAFGGYRSANSILLDRLSLIEQLRRMSAGEAFAGELRRKERLAERLDSFSRHAKAAGVVLPVNRTDPIPMLPDLPAGIDVAEGKLMVRFQDPEHLLARLYQLAQAAAEDYEGFCMRILPPSRTD